jgi:phosphatidylglycerophosphatase A
MKRFVAAGFGTGLIPNRLYGSHSGAGTFGAAVAVGIGLLLIDAPWWWDAAVAATAIVVSLWAAAPFAVDGQDPGWVAIDEVAGTLVAMIGLGGWPWVVAVVVARLLDIFKVAPGIRQAEALHGAVGVTLDDVVAGLYGLAAGYLLAGIV